MELKISVLSSGTVLLDGKPVDLAQLDKAFREAKENNATVLYYREAASSEGPPEAMEVIKLVIKHKLPIALSQEPDFSKVIGGGTDSRMPEVAVRPDIEDIFARIRTTAESRQGALVLLRPDRTHLVMPPLEQSPQLKASAEAMERVVPSAVKRNIAVIGNTGFHLPTVVEVAKFIPFLGMLMGLTYIGHAVWIFEGHPSAIAPGCRDADVLFVDGGMLPFLKAGWHTEAFRVMRNPNILVHDRATFKLRRVRKSPEQSIDGLEFPSSAV